jgi:hypothetical protein
MEDDAKPMSKKFKKPTFSGDFKEPTIEIIVRWKERKQGSPVTFRPQYKLTEICVYNEQEFSDLIDGIHRTVNAIRQGRT